MKTYFTIFYRNSAFWGELHWTKFKELEFSTYQETKNFITAHPEKFKGLTLTIQEIFEL